MHAITFIIISRPNGLTTHFLFDLTRGCTALIKYIQDQYHLFTADTPQTRKMYLGGMIGHGDTFKPLIS